VPRGKDDASLLGAGHTCSRPPLAGTSSAPYLNKYDRAILITHDQVNFAPTAPGRPIIALEQAQTGLLQVFKGLVFSRITRLLGGRSRRHLDGNFRIGEHH
jgi:hypothetical protein